MTQNVKNISEVLERAKENEGDDIFLACLTKQELERTGFDTSDFGCFEYVDIYLQYWDGEYTIKYRFDSDPRSDYYERERDVGGREGLLHDVQSYLALGGGE